MGEREASERALRLCQEAYRRQMQGELDDAIRLYRQSIDIQPTAEAHTFLGWTYSFEGSYDKAIEDSKKAIAVDPYFGNSYNDIVAFLLDVGTLEVSILW